MQEQLQGEHALALGPLQVDVLVRDGGEHLAAAFRTADQDVQAPLAAVGSERAEPHGDRAVRPRP